MEIGFVFTNYNNSGFTKKAIESIDLKTSYVVVVDNASNQEDVCNLKKLERDYSNVSVIYSKENLGYFSGLNVGIKHLTDEYNELGCIVVGNNDLIFPSDFQRQVESNSSLLKKYPIISPNIMTADGIPQNPHVVKRISKAREIVYDIYHMNYFFAKMIVWLAKITSSFTDRKDEEQFEKPQEIYQGYGACYILTPKFFKEFEELWSPTFLMSEEFFLSKQLSDKGYRIYYEPTIHIKHLMHATTDKLPGKLKWEYSRRAHREYRKYVKSI